MRVLDGSQLLGLRTPVLALACASVAVVCLLALPTSGQAVAPRFLEWREQVGYIIADEERQAFGRLRTSEEVDRFIEQFWERRDPTPDSAKNEFKEEHYRRIAFASDRFAYPVERDAPEFPGWKTDRGRVYIVLGPPDEIESRPKVSEQIGGLADNYPYEIWRYSGVLRPGGRLTLTFVDPTMTGEYRLAADPLELLRQLVAPPAG